MASPCLQKNVQAPSRGRGGSPCPGHAAALASSPVVPHLEFCAEVRLPIVPHVVHSVLCL